MSAPNPFSNFNPGFHGTLGTGAGMHSASSRESFNYSTFNGIENAIMQLYSLINSNGNYGIFTLETLASGYYTESFDGDNSTLTFNLNRQIAREFISGWDIDLDNPYVGIFPTGYGAYLSNQDSSTNLYSSITFATPPVLGTGNVIIYYKYPQSWGSSLGGSAYLSDYVFSG